MRFPRWRDAGLRRRHATFKELGVAVPGTGRYRGRYGGTTWSEPEWERAVRNRNAYRYEARANGSGSTDEETSK